MGWGVRWRSLSGDGLAFGDEEIDGQDSSWCEDEIVGLGIEDDVSVVWIHPTKEGSEERLEASFR
jgi:hypothetical protein